MLSSQKTLGNLELKQKGAMNEMPGSQHSGHEATSLVGPLDYDCSEYILKDWIPNDSTLY